MPMPPEFELALLAVTIWGEARGEKLPGKVGVAYTVINRCENQKKSMSEVVLAPFQFSFWNTEDPSRPKISLIDTQSELWQDCVDAAKAAMYHLVPDPTKGAEFYMNVDLVRRQRGGTLPKWWDSDTDPASQVVIGAHTFRRKLK